MIIGLIAGPIVGVILNDRIQKFTKDGKFIKSWGSTGSGDGQFKWPAGLTVDLSGNVYVADGGNDRIQKFTGGWQICYQMD
jgi:DNA-binding beta-propeller fold protein YncE